MREARHSGGRRVPAGAGVGEGGAAQRWQEGPRGGWGGLGCQGCVVWPPLTDMPPCQLHSRVPVDVGEQPQAEALRVGGVGEAIHRHGRLGGMECLPNALVELVVGDGAPEGRLAVGDGLQV